MVYENFGVKEILFSFYILPSICFNWEAGRHNEKLEWAPYLVTGLGLLVNNSLGWAPLIGHEVR